MHFDDSVEIFFSYCCCCCCIFFFFLFLLKILLRYCYWIVCTRSWSHRSNNNFFQLANHYHCLGVCLCVTVNFVATIFLFFFFSKNSYTVCIHSQLIVIWNCFCIPENTKTVHLFQIASTSCNWENVRWFLQYLSHWNG